jgi:hypothetical protein
VGGERRVAKMRNEVVEQLGGVEQRVKLLGHMSEMDGVMKERMQEQEAVMGQRLGEVGRQV